VSLTWDTRGVLVNGYDTLVGDEGQALGREALASHIKADDERRGQDGPERHLQNTKGTVQFGNAFHEPFCAGANTGNAAIEQGRR